MKDETPSRTAALVAVFRGLSPFLPVDAQLVADPFGLRFGGSAIAKVGAALAGIPVARRALQAIPPHSMLMWMQLRTRAIDEALKDFVRGGGKQVVLLGAGFDCRAARLVDDLPGVTFFEVDHPATQGQKRRVMAEAKARSATVRYLKWNFERDALSSLSARLSEIGHDPSLPTLTVWEGVTMYLSEAAIDATLEAVKGFSSSGSRIVFTYMDRDYVRSNTLSARFVARVGEPWTFGWNPPDLPAFLSKRGLSLITDDDMDSLAKRWLSPRFYRDGDSRGRHVALAQIT